MKAFIISIHAGLVLLAPMGVATALPAQQPAGIERQPHRERPSLTPSIGPDSSAPQIGQATRPASPDSSRKDTRRQLTYVAVGGVLGAAIGAVVGNQLAQAHKPACVNVPAGPPCRVLDPDNSSSYRALGIGLGAGLGMLIGFLRVR